MSDITDAPSGPLPEGFDPQKADNLEDVEFPHILRGLSIWWLLTLA
jgi:hypothetical protein